MKILKQFAIILLFAVFTTQAYSQLSLGGQVSYLKMAGVSNIGFGLKGEFALSDRNMVSFGFTYYLPKSSASYNTNAVAIDFFNTTPVFQDVAITEKIGFINIFVEGKRYFVGETDGSFNVYGFAGVGFLRASVNLDVEDYDTDLYDLEYSYESYSLSQLTINLGIGAEKDLGFGYLFLDFKFNLPANKQNGQTVEINLPASMNFNLGVRIPFE